jgi:hypothetical protein
LFRPYLCAKELKHVGEDAHGQRFANGPWAHAEEAIQQLKSAKPAKEWGRVVNNQESDAGSCFILFQSIPVRLAEQDLQDDRQLLGGVLCVVAAHVQPHLESSKLIKEKEEG